MAEAHLPTFALGTDIVLIPRVARGIATFGERYLNKLLTANEIAYCLSQHPITHRRFSEKVAVRIAAKEAAAKALGCGLNGLGYQDGLDWHHLETYSQPQAAPIMLLHGPAKTLADQKHLREWHLSWAHDGDVATATVIGSR